MCAACVKQFEQDIILECFLRLNHPAAQSHPLKPFVKRLHSCLLDCLKRPVGRIDRPEHFESCCPVGFLIKSELAGKIFDTRYKRLSGLPKHPRLKQVPDDLYPFSILDLDESINHLKFL